MFKLIVKSEQAQSATIPVSWCAERALFYDLQIRVDGDQELFVLLVVIGPNGKEKRYLRPLSEGMAYVPFFSPGENTIYGMVVWQKGNSHLGCQCLNFNNEYYANHVLKFKSDNGNDLDEPLVVGRFNHIGFTSIKVEVAEGFFAKKPPQWLASWVNFFYGKSCPDDECDFRKRMIIAFTIQPILLAIWIPIVVVARTLFALWFIAIGVKPTEIGWSAIIHPISEKNENVNWNIVFPDSCWWNIKIKNYKLESMVMFSPLALIIFAGVVFVCLCIGGKEPIELQSYTATLATSVLIVALLIESFAFSVSKIELGSVRFKARLFQPIGSLVRGEAPRDRPWFAYEDNTAYLLCDGSPRPLAFAELPKKQKTVYLRFQDLKARMCKPFAQ
ncbi:MAG: hypothetical protein ABIH21_01240 [Patescibacteria group bacterium]